MSEEMVEPSVALAHTDRLPTALPEARRQGKVRMRLTREQLWERRSQMAVLHAQGKYLRTIADQYGVSVGHVSKELDSLVQEFRAQALKSIGEKIAKEEALIYMVQLEATQAWFESKDGKVTNNKKRSREIRSALTKDAKKKPGRNTSYKKAQDTLEAMFSGDWDESQIEDEAQPDVEKHEEYRRTEESPGDPRFLQIILDCSDRRAKLNALYPKQDFNGGIGGQGADEDFADWTPQQRLARLTKLFDKAKQEKAKKMSLTGEAPAAQRPSDEELWDATA